MLYYTDGGCSPNPGRGGWGFVVVEDKNDESNKHAKFGGEDHTTNNRMELTAILEALEYAKFIGDENITIYSDSQLCVNTCSKWIFGWKLRGFIDKKKNPDLLNKVLPLLYELQPNFKWVRGHNGDKWNEYADKLSGEYIKNRSTYFSHRLK